MDISRRNEHANTVRTMVIAGAQLKLRGITFRDFLRTCAG